MYLVCNYGVRLVFAQDHIIRYIHSLGMDRIVLEYVELGSLVDEHRRARISCHETLVILRQAVGALAFLHGQGYTHRDVKPDNILVKYRRPLHVKLADFGLVQQNQLLRTCCGTNYYTAPEVWSGSYTPAIDIWSLGVIVLEYARGHPQYKEDVHPTQWCKDLVQAAKRTNDDPLVDLVCTNMLTLNPLERLSASECHRVAARIPVELVREQSKYPKLADVVESKNKEDVESKVAVEPPQSSKSEKTITTVNDR